MPLYSFRCDNCNKEYDIQMKLAEHAETKDKLTCQECSSKLIQVVSPLRFKLAGSGWFNQEYGITQGEINTNLDQEKKVEDLANNFTAKDKSIKEL